MNRVRSAIYSILVVHSFWAGLAFGQSPDNAASDRAWIQKHLESIHKSLDTGYLTGKERMLYDLGLLDANEKQAILNLINKHAEKGRELKELPKSKLPFDIAERVLAAFKFLKDKNLVLVEIGTTSEIGKFDSRYGVMTTEEYEKIYGKGRGSDLVGRDCEIPHGGENIKITCDYKILLEYVTFGCRYNEKSRTWERKYAPQSNELSVINQTQEIIVSIYEHDINFHGAPRIRQHMSENLKKFLANNHYSSDHFHEAVKREITLFHLRDFFQTYKKDLTEKRLLSENPTDADLLKFADANRDKFYMGIYQEPPK